MSFSLITLFIRLDYYIQGIIIKPLPFVFLSTEIILFLFFAILNADFTICFVWDFNSQSRAADVSDCKAGADLLDIIIRRKVCLLL